jgi:DNA (cytosine-5)-methyltransferase 1
MQVLDNLFFHFIDIAAKLKPKIVVAENVKGLISGKARGYVKEIFSSFRAAGYDCQLFLLNSSRMGVPQVRERTFFVARRMDLSIQKLSINFNEKPITVKQAIFGLESLTKKNLPTCIIKRWPKVAPGQFFSTLAKGSYFSWRKLHPNKPSTTVTSKLNFTHWSEPRFMTIEEIARIQTFPDDFDYVSTSGSYVCGMSVPPLMMQRIANEIAKVLLNK